jgi:type IV secretion system protein VirD4
MSQATLAWAAFKNMLRLPPVIRYGRSSLCSRRSGSGAICCKSALSFCSWRSFSPPSAAASRKNGGSPARFRPARSRHAAGALLAFRFLTNPLIIHFGDMDGETHGSARFATDKETAPSPAPIPAC